VKKALVVILVVVLVVTGLPVVVMGMSAMAGCQDCGPAAVGETACILAILAAGAALAFALLSRRLGSRREAMPRLLYGFLFERPPRLA